MWLCDLQSIFTYISSLSQHTSPVRDVNIVAVLQTETDHVGRKDLNYNLNLSSLFRAFHCTVLSDWVSQAGPFQTADQCRVGPK